MYSEWASVQSNLQQEGGGNSALHVLSESVGRSVACSVIKDLVQSHQIGGSYVDKPSSLEKDDDVKWTMQVLSYCLTQPLTELDAIRDCVKIYCDWLSVLAIPKVCVPTPVIESPNFYAQIMIKSLFNVFVPRPDANADLVSRQVVYCHSVLRNIQQIVKESTILNRETWEELLKFLLSVNETLLASPTVQGSLGHQLCERVVSFLFWMWLQSCAQCFPSPPLWKTLREMCSHWRHHEALVLQWHQVNAALTSQLLKNMYGPDYPEFHVGASDYMPIVENMSSDCVSQTWFRMLHTLGNPVDLCRPEVISNTPKFLHLALTSQTVMEPSQQECLKNLPHIYYKAMKSLAIIIDAFLGILNSSGDLDGMNSLAGSNLDPAFTPPQNRKSKSFLSANQSTAKVNSGSRGSGAVHKVSNASINSTSGSPPVQTAESIALAQTRPTVNSLLHLYGTWLFEAAIAKVKHQGSTVLSRSRTTSFLDHDTLRLHSLADGSSKEEEAGSGDYEAGRAEACGTLCRIICSHRTNEEILPDYLTQFYIIMHYALDASQENEQVLANVIFNSRDILRIDLGGVMVLLPRLLKAIEVILKDSFSSNSSLNEAMQNAECRRASIHLLLSMITLPLHFKSLQIQGIVTRPTENQIKFHSLKMPILDLLLHSLTSESDSTNTQMLLGGLMLAVQDLAMCEEAELATAQQEEGGPPALVDDTRGTACGLFGQAASIVCNRLMASWKTDLKIALAALEVLSGLAKVKLTRPDPLMCKRTVNWICEFIVFQCSRPKPAHSKDLHSMIVAAFNCLCLWFVDHEYLMNDKECLACVLEVVELGISGSKSQNRASDIPKLKGEKEQKPVSQRVYDAAEYLLAVIMDHVGSFPPPCGPESVCSLLDEDTLLKYGRDGTLPEAGAIFRYYVLDGTTIVGLLEQPLGNDQDSLPTVTALIRGPFGRHAWTMQSRHFPRNKKVLSKATLPEPERPQPDDTLGVHHNIKHRYFPEVVDTIPKFEVDRSIPELSDTLTDKSDELSKLETLIQDQVMFEERVAKEAKERELPSYECKAPSPTHEFQTARLFLSHYGFLHLDALKEHHSIPAQLMSLDGQDSEFMKELASLDNIPCRTHDTVHVFYVKSGQKMPFEILSNVTHKEHVHKAFLEFLLSLGWPVDVKKHAGWTGNSQTSWKLMEYESEEDEFFPADTGGSLYDGRKQVLYWADVMSEVAFVVPSPDTYNHKRRRSSVDSGSEKSFQVNPNMELNSSMTNISSRIDFQATKNKHLSLDLADKQAPSTGRDSTTPTNEPAALPRMRRPTRTGAQTQMPDTKIFVVWLESYEDYVHFPTDDLLPSTNTSQENVSSTSNLLGSTRNSESPIYIIFIHALQNGLFRIHISGKATRIQMAIPLVDGMVVSRRALGSLVRQTAVNVCRRIRLDNSDIYQPPHIRRKAKIKNIVKNFQNKMIEPEFYTNLFQDVTR